MKVVILAAGKGSRLGSADLPKPLTCLVTGQTILERQLQTIKNYLPLDLVIVVVGYKQEMITRLYPNLHFIYNPDYASVNTSKSLLHALKQLDEDVLWLNGDVVMHPSIIESALAASKTGMVVNVGAVAEEEVKYRLNDAGAIAEVSKSVDTPQGEALGINYWEKKDLKSLCRNLEKCANDDYFERAIELCIDEGMLVYPIVVPGTLCTEIDFPEDLEKANQMIQQW